MKRVWYEIEVYTKSGNLSDCLGEFDTKEEAKQERDFQKGFMPEYKYKIVKRTANTIYNK